MAYVITAKYVDGLPLYRLSGIFERYGVDFPQQTLSESVLAVAAKLEPLLQYLGTEISAGPLMHMDETRVQALNEPGELPQSQSYMWVQRGGPPGTPIACFVCDPGRSTVVPEQLLKEYQGVLMSDGYKPYRTVAAVQGLTHLCCWAHARRRFTEAQKAQPKGCSGRADKGLAMIDKLYAVEKQCRDSDAATRHRTRQESSVPALTTLKAWLEDVQ